MATGALIAVAGLVAAYGALGAALSPGMISPAGSAQIGFFGTFLFGILPVTFFGVPMYVWVSRTDAPTGFLYRRLRSSPLRCCC